MLRQLIFVVASAFAVSAADHPSYPMPEFTIDLDQPADQRWNHVMAALKPDIMKVMDWLLGIVGPGKPMHYVAEPLRKAVLEANSWDSEFLDEINGVAKALNTSVVNAQYAQLFYEFGPLACTGIVTTLPNNGTVIHSRNQDFSIPGLPEITIWVKFVKGGELQYQGTTFASYIGLPTAMKTGTFSVEANTRFTGGAIDFETNIQVAKQGGLTVGYFIRKNIATLASYKEAISVWSNQLLIAPAYYTMAGINDWQGAVITRDRDGLADNSTAGRGLWVIAPPTAEDPDSWYRLETNFDHWTPVQDGRRLKGNELMKKITHQHVNLSALYSVLSTPPVLATDTIYTAQMVPATGYYTAYLRRLQ
eukprot:TRINITY_DN5143_c1_g1_i1.p1 TRINITY_DN5143_c1_g1~~TRINITY_DN5143_c1_g1_i1.p1  ORF type:complete len:382 (+),score=78.49 TRINITY_DN5143_c1_g1_i1:60-1148(+)